MFFKPKLRGNTLSSLFVLILCFLQYFANKLILKFEILSSPILSISVSIIS